MPTSNGQVGRYDIRRLAVHTDHIVDDAVITEKIPDLAVTFPDKIDDPIWSSTFYEPLFHNASLTTTPTSFGTLTVDVPAWVDAISVFAIGIAQFSNTSGGNQRLEAGVEIDGEVESGNSQDAANNLTATLTVGRVANLVGVAGSSFTVDMEVSVATGTNSSNKAQILGIVVGRR